MNAENPERLDDVTLRPHGASTDAPPVAGRRRLSGGLIERGRRLPFVFDDRRFEGHPGDTLASALLANGQRLVARSFKYHRPRGVFSAGAEEPNALVTIGTGAHADPNTRATVAELYPWLEARSQNHVGPLAFDPMALNDRLSAFLGAGFYYKTFMWPKAFWERVYEPLIRRAAGLGALSGRPDPDTYERGWLHADLLIAGAGPAGLAAALAAGRAGLRVVLADEDFLPGGRLNAERDGVDDVEGHVWAARAVAELDALDNVRRLARTTVIGAFDHGMYGALERLTDHLPARERSGPRQILWRVRATRVIVATGATERSIAFGDNDRPGVMLAGSVRAYANRWAVASGRRVAVFTNNDDGWRTARDLAAAGVEVHAVIDTRAEAGGTPATDIGGVPGARLFADDAVAATRGRLGLTGVTLLSGERLDVDCLAVAGGWNPNVQLTCHQRGRPRWREDLAAFVPGGTLPDGMRVAGAADGELTLGAALRGGNAAARAVLENLGRAANVAEAPRAEDEAAGIRAFWHVGGERPERERSGRRRLLGDRRPARAWIDLQNDVTTKDLALARREGFHAVEHLKRYTTLGMATDQGKTSNVLGLAIMAEQSGRTIPESGTTIFRPPVTPVAIGAFAGRSRGRDFRPTRRTPSHAWAEERGAVFVETGAWLRAQWFPEPGERHWHESVAREVLGTRGSVGVCDVSTLGKIDVQGRDAATFLDRVYANTFSTLAVGRVRYGLMLREDGLVMDDGTTARLGEHRFLMTTTTANAALVYRHLEFCRQCLWPGLDVHLISETEQWAQFAIAGPNSRRLLERVIDGTDLSNEAFPFMACGDVTLAGGVRGRLFRISFSGELAYEIAVPSRYGDALVRALMSAGEEFDVVPYGTEALGVMRIEKGHAAGAELTGTTTAAMLGLGRMVSKKKDSIGSVLSERAAIGTAADARLVGFVPLDRDRTLRAGAHFLSADAAMTTENDQGWMTSVARSPTLGHSIGLGFIDRGAERHGEIVRAADPVRGEEIAVEIVSPHFVDPDGERLRG